MSTPLLPPVVAAATSITTTAMPVAGSETAAQPPPSPPPATRSAQQVAGAILEVLAGVRSITDAALVLGITPARYYVLEARAVEGLIAACEPRSPGPATGSALAAEVDRLRAERDRLRDEAARYQALARIAQVAFGPAGTQPAADAAGPRTARAAAPTASGRPRKKRTPTVRALRLAQRVQQAQQQPAELPHSAASPLPPPLATPGPAAGG
jgi:hypothetical protein